MNATQKNIQKGTIQKTAGPVIHRKEHTSFLANLAVDALNEKIYGHAILSLGYVKDIYPEMEEDQSIEYQYDMDDKDNDKEYGINVVSLVPGNNIMIQSTNREFIIYMKNLVNGSNIFKGSVKVSRIFTHNEFSIPTIFRTIASAQNVVKSLLPEIYSDYFQETEVLIKSHKDEEE